MEQIIRIGMDTSKHVFQLHGVNGAEQPVLRKKLRRKEMVEFFGRLPPTVVAIEACGGSHRWARELQLLGHEVKMLPPQYVKPYVKRGKNDAADAEALCEAMSRPTMRCVPVKTADQQASLMLVGMRDRLVRNRTQLANAIRGYAAEFGLTAAKGMRHIAPLLGRIVTDETLPAMARDLFAIHAREYVQLQAEIEKVEARLMAWHRADECSRRLAQIPGVGPIGASLLMMKTPAPGHAHPDDRKDSTRLKILPPARIQSYACGHVKARVLPPQGLPSPRHLLRQTCHQLPGQHPPRSRRHLVV